MPLVSLGRPRGPPGSGYVEPRRRGRGTLEHVGASWAQACLDGRSRPWRIPGSGSVSTVCGTTELRTWMPRPEDSSVALKAELSWWRLGSGGWLCASAPLQFPIWAWRVLGEPPRVAPAWRTVMPIRLSHSLPPLPLMFSHLCLDLGHMSPPL